MPAEALLRPARLGARLSWEAAAVAMFALLSAAYFFQATALAARSPLWMDEILTLWTARQPDMSGVWSALRHGGEFTPPLYDLFIHWLLGAGVGSVLGLRVPSILAVYLAALAVGAVVRRHAGIAPAAVAAGALLSSGLFGYAVQMRPYALVTAAFAMTLALHDRPGRASNRRLAAIAALLALAIGMHFYALLLAAALTAVELVRARADGRKPCLRTLAAIALGASTILFWMPLLAAARAYSAADVGAPGYYARPTFVALARTYAVLLGWLVVPLIALLATTVRSGGEARRLRTIAILVAAVPILVFAFALLLSHSYSDRYALAGAIGIALLFGALLYQLGSRSAPASALALGVLLLATPWRASGELGKPDRLQALAAIDAAPAGLPIATGSGLRYFEARENSINGGRMVFLDVSEAAPPDPTNRNQVLRWKTIDSGLPVAHARAFLCATPAFYLFAQPPDGGADALPEWLAGRADFTPPPPARASLALVHPHPCTGSAKQ